ncbi:MAG TPA: nicotinate (nicotinamide) nucleotide adenylyltransferase [Epsilonproteobacteria bacterium]|nr:nicotinate (nicotinamide) nucleotide adenylyltransferase [Campylobacterota bacterium]
MVKKHKPVAAMFGGSFDPPHRGHQSIVQEVVQSLDIDTLLIVPAYLNPFKVSSLASTSMRLEWCHVLFDNIPKVVVDNYEIKEGKSTYTSDTVKHFNIAYEVKYLIIGSDNLTSLSKWHQYEWLNANIIWVIITRDGHTLDLNGLREYRVLTLDEKISSTEIRTSKDLHYVDNKIKKSVQKVLEGQTLMTIEERVENIVNILDDKKADEIEVFNLENADYIAKRVVIANSLNGKHTLALADHLKKGLKETGDSILASDMSDDWVVADLGDILVHIMIPEYRQRYSLEQFLSELVETQNKNKDIDPA